MMVRASTVLALLLFSPLGAQTDVEVQRSEVEVEGLGQVTWIALAGSGTMAIGSSVDISVVLVDTAGLNVQPVPFTPGVPQGRPARGGFWPDGRLFVIDDSGAGYMTFNPHDRTSARSTISLPRFEAPRSPAAFPMAILPDGSFVVQANAGIGHLTAGGIEELPVVVASAGGEVIRQLYSKAVGRMGLSVASPSGGMTQMLQPFRVDPLTAVSSDLEHLVVVERDQRLGPSIVIRWIPTGGGDTHQLEIPLDRRPLRPAEVDDWLAKNRPEARDDGPVREAWLAAIDPPTYHAPVNRVVAGPSQSALVRIADEDGAWLLVSTRRGVLETGTTSSGLGHAGV